MGRTRRATWDGIEVEGARNVQGDAGKQLWCEEH